MSDRHIPLEGASNFRDFGGYPGLGGPVKRGALFRSGGLAGLTDADHAALRSLQIRLICDLRRQSELDHMPTRWPATPGPTLWHVPLLKDDENSSIATWATLKSPDAIRAKMVETYKTLVRAPSILEKYKTIFERLTQSDSTPIVIHCSAGKDRTGVVCALILSALGVERQTIMEDYLLTARYYDAAIAFKRLSSQVLDFGSGHGWTAETLAPVFGVDHTYLGGAFEEIDATYGSVDGFFGACGITAETIGAIRSRLLD